MGVCTITMKICLLIVSAAFWAVSVGFLFVGSYVFSTYHNFENFTSSTMILVPATIMLVIGVVMFFIGCVGCCSAVKENRCLLAFFFTMVLMILLLEVAAAILTFAFSYDKTLKKKVIDELDTALAEYNNTNCTTYKEEMDYVQKELHCCGVTNYTDWETVDLPIPESCYKHGNNGTQQDLYQQGCETKLVHILQDNLKYIAIVSVVFAALQLLALIASCVLIRRYRVDSPYSLLGDGGSGGGLTV